jgi:hypothetical protein
MESTPRGAPLFGEISMRQTTQTNKQTRQKKTKQNKSNQILNNDLLYFHVFLTELVIRYPRVHRLIYTTPRAPGKTNLKMGRSIQPIVDTY